MVEQRCQIVGVTRDPSTPVVADALKLVQNLNTVEARWCLDADGIVSIECSLRTVDSHRNVLQYFIVNN